MPNAASSPPGNEPEQVPAANARWAMIGIFLIMAFGALSVAQLVFIPIVTAVILALVFSPVRRALGKLGIGPGLAATLIFVSALSAVALIIYAASDTLAQRLNNAPEIMEQAELEIRELLGTVQPMLDATEKMSEIGGEPAKETVVIREPGFFVLAAKATPEAFGQIVITLTLAFFLIASGDLFYEKLVQSMPTFKDKRRALQIARDIEAQLSNYLFTITAINAGVAVLVGLVAWGFGLPDPVLFGVAAFLLNYIPYLGPIAGFAAMFLTGLVVLDSPFAALVPTFLYWLINTAEGQIVTPVMLGRRLRMNAVVVFLSFAVWAWLWGFMGMLLATPILLSLKVVADRVPGMSGLGKFLAARDDDMSTRDQRILSFIFRQKPAPVPVPSPPGED